MPIHLYIIIALLLSNLTTASFWLWNRSTIVDLENQVTVLKASSASKDAANEVKEKIVTVVDELCEKKLKDIQGTNKELNDKKNELDKTLAIALNTINSDRIKASSPTTPANPKQPVMTYDEAKEIVNYLSTPVPKSIEYQLWPNRSGKTRSDNSTK